MARGRPSGQISALLAGRNADSGLAELAEKTATVEASAWIEVEDLLLSVNDEQHLLAVDFVSGSHRLLHHVEVNLVARQKFELLHDEAIAHPAALREIGSAKPVTATGRQKAEQRGKYDRFDAYPLIAAADRALFSIAHYRSVASEFL